MPEVRRVKAAHMRVARRVTVVADTRAVRHDTAPASSVGDLARDPAADVVGPVRDRRAAEVRSARPASATATAVRRGATAEAEATGS
jgi:hypothetical protein